MLLLLLSTLGLLILYVAYKIKQLWKLFNHLKNPEKPIKDQVYTFFHKKIYILHDLDDVKTVLKRDCKLSYFNKNFNKINGLENSITNYESDTETRSLLHRNNLNNYNKNRNKLAK